MILSSVQILSCFYPISGLPFGFFPDVVLIISWFSPKEKSVFSSFCIFVRFQQNSAGLSGFLSPRNAICIVKRNKKAGRIAPLSGLIRPAYLCCFRLTYAKFFDYNQCNLTPKVWECRTEGVDRKAPSSPPQRRFPLPRQNSSMEMLFTRTDTPQ